VTSPWNRASGGRTNEWDVDRALAAFHVYVHLSLLATLAEQRYSELAPRFGRFPISRLRTSREQAVARATYLGGKLEDGCWDDLGPAGQTLVRWLQSVLEIISPERPPQGSYIHLLLDLYERESDIVERFLARHGDAVPQSYRAHLDRLAQEEIAATRTALQLSGSSSLVDFNARLSPDRAHLGPGTAAALRDLGWWGV
jgi:hypothetical protein